MAPPRDYYEVLGVRRDADATELQRSYRRLARELHPDMNKDPAATERFKEVSEAYEVLSDPEQRRRYDAFGHDFRHVPEGVDPSDFAASGAARGGRTADSGGTRARRSRRAGGTGAPEADFDFDFSDLFGGLYGTRFGSVNGADQEAEVSLSLEEAYHGTRRRIELGTGGPAIEVTVPPGVREGQRIRIAGQGGEGFGGGRRGDLYLRVHIDTGPRFRLDGRDVYVDLPLAPWEAALGTTVAVWTPDGDAKIKVPVGSSTGRRIRLAGRGLPNPRGKPGDLYAEVKVMVPSRPTAEERRLLDELRAVSHFDPRRGS